MKLRDALISLAIVSFVVFVLIDRQQTKSELAELRAQLAAVAEDMTTVTASVRIDPGSIPWPRAVTTAERKADAPVESAAERPRRAAADQPRAPETRVEAFARTHKTIEGSFQAEPMEADWASHAKYLAQDKLTAALGPESRIESIECRSSMCRIRSVHADPNSANQFINSKLGQDDSLPWRGPFTVGVVEEAPNNGPVTLITYLGREGHHLPLVPSDDDR
jgi:hypothetical protein